MNISTLGSLKNIQSCLSLIPRRCITTNRNSQLKKLRSLSCCQKNHPVKSTTSYTGLQHLQKLNTQLIINTILARTLHSSPPEDEGKIDIEEPEQEKFYIEVFIPFSVNEKELLFDFLEVDESQVECDILYGTNGRHFGTAIIQTDNKDVARKILSKGGTVFPETDFSIDARTIDGHRANGFLGKTVLKVFGIPYTWTKSDIRQFFIDFELLGIILPGSKYSMYNNTGIAYVQTLTEEAKLKALEELSNKYVGERYVEIAESNLADAFMHARRLKLKSTGDKEFGGGPGGFSQRGGGFERGFGGRGEGGFQRGFGERREGGFGERREGGFGERREGGFERGFGERREGGFGERREGGFERGFGERREGGFGGREGGFARRGGYGEGRGGFGGREDGYGSRREGGFGGGREGGFEDGERRRGFEGREDGYGGRRGGGWKGDDF